MDESILDRAKASTAMFKDKVADLRKNLWDDERKELIGEFLEPVIILTQLNLASLN